MTQTPTRKKNKGRMAGEAIAGTPIADEVQKAAGSNAMEETNTAASVETTPEAASQPPSLTDAQRSQQDARTKLEEGAKGGKSWADTASENAKSAYKVGALKDFDLRSFGAGGSQTKANQDADTIGKGRARLSKADVKGLMRDGGYGAQELMDYGNDLEAEDAVFGGKAQNFLRKKLGLDPIETNTGGGTGTEGEGVVAAGGKSADPSGYMKERTGGGSNTYGVNVDELDERINSHTQYWGARSDVQTGDYLGDIWSMRPPEFKMPAPMKPVEKPDIRGISEDWAKRIEGIEPEI